MINVENVINDLVGYNNLKICQCKDFFNFSLESILLPNFAIITNKTKNIMDLGTGNAPIPLILSTKTKEKIIGVEVQKEIYDLAIESVRINGLDDRIEIINEDILNVSKLYDTDSFDLILCNPPYFKINEFSLRSENIVKSNARHENLINIEDIIVCSRKLLKNGGSLVLVHRTERLCEILEKMKKNNIEPKRIKFIYPKKDSESNMVLIEGRKNAKEGVIVEKGIIVHNSDGSYTKEVNILFERN